MTGLELARQLYRDKVRGAIAAEFPEYESRIAVGLAGPGSECFGYDDEISRDHDFAPRLCLWLTEDDARAVGQRLRILLGTALKSYEQAGAFISADRVRRQLAENDP